MSFCLLLYSVLIEITLQEAQCQLQGLKNPLFELTNPMGIKQLILTSLGLSFII